MEQPHPGFQPVSDLPFRRPLDRVVVVDTVYHQPATGNPTSIDTRFAQLLSSQEQPYERTTTVGEEWTELDRGWIEECSQMVLVNEEGRDLRFNPTPEEKLVTSERILELSDSSGPSSAVWLIPPGQSFRGCPADLKTLRIRCRKGSLRFTVCLFPA